MEHTLSEGSNKTNQSTTVKPKTKKVSVECKICGAPAFYSYVGVIVCCSCKMFFKRNAEIKQGQSKCLYNDHCEINISNRHVCSSCRLAKCFASGMQIEMLRSSRTTKNKTRGKKQITTVSTVSAATDQMVQLPTLNLLRSDQSTLSVEEWNLLSNLIHCYDEYSGFALAQRYIREQNELPPKLRFKLESVNEFFTLITNAGQCLYIKNADFISLCSHDRSVLLHNSIKYAAGLGTCFIIRHTGLLDNLALYKSMEVIYGLGTMAAGHRAIDQLYFDSTFIKLVLALLSFSTFHYVYYTSDTRVNLENIKTSLRIQDMYTELVWRYLIYKYDHQQAVIYFSNFIRCLFSLNDSVMDAIQGKQYTDMINSMVKRTEETLTLIECWISLLSTIERSRLFLNKEQV